MCIMDNGKICRDGIDGIRFVAQEYLLTPPDSTT